MPFKIRKNILIISVVLTGFFLILSRFNHTPLPSTFNFILFSIISYLIWLNYKKSNLNKDIILLFLIFYIFLSFGLGVFFNPLNFNSYDVYAKIYLFGDIVITFNILFISLYLFFYSVIRNKKLKPLIILLSLSISFVVCFAFFFNFFPSFEQMKSQIGALYAERSYYVKVLSIFLLLVFWLSYYRKNFTLSEYLNLIIFFFMLYSVLDALYYIAGGVFDVNLFMYSLYITTIINLLTLYLWWKRLVYLYSPEAIENERYLENFEYLKGLVKKPRQGLAQKIFSVIPPGFVILTLVFVMLVLAGTYWYFRSFSNFFITLNLMLILFAIASALVISVVAIKRDWKNQYKFIKQKKNKMKKISVL